MSPSEEYQNEFVCSISLNAMEIGAFEKGLKLSVINIPSEKKNKLKSAMS